MIKAFNGDFLIYRKIGKRNLAKTAGGSTLPSFRHKSRESADAEAERLLGLFPDSTFIIMQEVGTVKGEGK